MSSSAQHGAPTAPAAQEGTSNGAAQEAGAGEEEEDECYVAEGDDQSLVTALGTVLALAWFISYASNWWVETAPLSLPCTWGVHGCAPHHLCKAEWPSLLSVPACKPLEPQALPQNHPPVPAGAGLCAAALEAAGRSWPFGLPATVIVAGLCAGCGGAALRMRRRKKAPYEPSRPPNLEAWLAEHVRAPISESRQHPPPASRSG